MSALQLVVPQLLMMYKRSLTLTFPSGTLTSGPTTSPGHASAGTRMNARGLPSVSVPLPMIQPHELMSTALESRDHWSPPHGEMVLRLIASQVLLMRRQSTATSAPPLRPTT